MPGTGVDAYSRALLRELREYLAAGIEDVKEPEQGFDRILMTFGPGPTDPYAAMFAEFAAQSGLPVLSLDPGEPAQLPRTGDLVVDAQDLRTPGLTRAGVCIPAAVRVLDLTGMGSIRHDVVDRTRELIDSLVDAALSLSDRLSVQTALAIICDQVVGVARHILEVSRTQDPPYLMTGLYEHTRDDTVVDVGAADGDTLDSFSHLHPAPATYLAYEFDPLLSNRLHRRATRITSIRQILIRAVAVSDRQGRGEFVLLPGTGASHQSTRTDDATLAWAGAQKKTIDTVNLDSELTDRHASLIKIDAEGAELAVLHGARRTLQRDRPVLAVAAYHEVADLPVLLTWLRSTLSGYSYHLRKYEYGTFAEPGPAGRFFLETVLYAVPHERALQSLTW